MAGKRLRTADLARLLNAAGRPIYVLDDELAIVFCNEACLEWLAAGDDELIGRRCAYHSSPDATGPDAVAAGLCPPPTAMAGKVAAAIVARCDAEGKLHRRRARFTPLGDPPDAVFAMVVLLDEEDLPEDVADATVLSSSTREPTSEELHDAIRQFRHGAALRHRIDRLVGDSPAMRRVRAQVELAAGCRAAVLVVGPPGSGRRHVAAAIHYGGDPNREGTLIPLDCSALGAELIRSTIHALVANPSGGDAERSTLLLNEVDRLPVEVHGELAELFSSKSFRPRLLATAEQPLVELVRHGEYRSELAAMLGTLAIELPPLAERREDLPLLAQVLLEELNSRGAKQVGGFASDALDRLDAYPWPGNVDELARMIAEAHKRAEGPEITAADLPKRIHLAADAAAHPRPVEETIELDKLLAEIECELIHRALAQAKGNKAKASRLLGLTRPRLYRRMVQLGLEK